MTNKELEKAMTGLIAKVDEDKAELKSIKNYKCDNMCTDYLRSLNKKRAEIYYDWEKCLKLDANSFKTFDLKAYETKQTKHIDGMHQTLLYLKSRAPIKNPYGPTFL